MPKRLAGFRKRTRHKLQKSARNAGKISLKRFFQKLLVGDKVSLNAEPAVHGGLYRMKFHNKNGIVVGMKGRCYEVAVKDGGKTKTFIVHPVHLKKQV